MNPVVTLIVTVGPGGSRWLPEALASAANQTWRPLEVIIWGDGVVIANVPPRGDVWWTTADASHQGRGEALNGALRLARGAFVGLLDADDVAAPDMVERLAEHLRRWPHEVAATGDKRWMKPDGRLIGRPETGPLRLEGFDSIHPCLWRREALRGFRVKGCIAVDMELAAALLAKGAVGHVGKALYYKRRHDGSLSATQRAGQAAAAMTIKEQSA